MEKLYCSNYTTCKLVTVDGFLANQSQKKNYLNQYCEADKKQWENCKRFVTKEALGFCPDFVLPDINLSLDEIIDKFDESVVNN